VDLGTKISEKSPFVLWIFGKTIHSKTKMDIFYGMLLGTLLIVSGLLGFGFHSGPSIALPTEISSAGGEDSIVDQTQPHNNPATLDQFLDEEINTVSGIAEAEEIDDRSE
jgi:hypothetical protein